jgi:hypothetical protein
MRGNNSTKKRKYRYRIKEPTERICVHCHQTIYTLYDDDGICYFAGKYRLYCHRNLCQKVKKKRMMNVASGWEYMNLEQEQIVY